MWHKNREFTMFHRKSWLRGQDAGKTKEPWNAYTDLQIALKFYYFQSFVKYEEFNLHFALFYGPIRGEAASILKNCWGSLLLNLQV